MQFNQMFNTLHRILKGSLSCEQFSYTRAVRSAVFNVAFKVVLQLATIAQEQRVVDQTEDITGYIRASVAKYR
ncbi:hypothetical protein DK37_13720 [Halomonas sp. SUBG004]|nr:hypothetical protein DK37_13720 [Halomonas sp. SUBG004]